MSVLRLAIASPLRRAFDYLPPPDMDTAHVTSLQPGVRLRVPFGSREVTGYLLAVGLDSELEPSSLRPAKALLDPEPLIDARLLELCRWAADYYQHPVGEVMSALFPRKLREGGQYREAGDPAWRLNTRGGGLPEGALARSPRQAEALTMLRQEGTVSAVRFKEAGIGSPILARLREKNLVESCVLPALSEQPVSRRGLDLNSEQTTVMRDLKVGPGFSCHLLEGVTGSGKTEIYLQLITACLARGQQALVLIPEIGLTPQTLDRFQQRFGGGIAVLHSGLSDARRYRAWDAARCGRARIVIGTRSAVFTPLENLGLVIVDEEHDGSYKQQDGFRYSARDVAVKRGQISACQVLLGSATPSLESLQNALAERYHLHALTRRAGNGELPSLDTLDIRRQALTAGLSAPLVEAVHQTLHNGQQALLFLNRRGYAPTLQCHDCGWLAECHACDARLTVHRRQRRLRCHHCGSARPLPPDCPECHSNQLLAAGLGTEQAEDFLRQRFDQWPVFRVDSDSMEGRDAMQSLVDEINRGEPCILLGTQMLTKGHHFPAVSLVAVIDTDAMLFSPDFRGEERMAQLLTQVAGRAGRANHPGRVLLQTHYPDHPALRALLTSSYPELARALLQQRRAAGMPPAGQLLMLRTDCADLQRGEGFLRRLRTATAALLPPGCSLIGPLPSPMQRRAGKFRSQLLLTAPGRRDAQVAARLLVREAEKLPTRGGIKWSIDVDPTDGF